MDEKERVEPVQRTAPAPPRGAVRVTGWVVGAAGGLLGRVLRPACIFVGFILFACLVSGGMGFGTFVIFEILLILVGLIPKTMKTASKELDDKADTMKMDRDGYAVPFADTRTRAQVRQYTHCDRQDEAGIRDDGEPDSTVTQISSGTKYRKYLVEGRPQAHPGEDDEYTCYIYEEIGFDSDD